MPADRIGRVLLAVAASSLAAASCAQRPTSFMVTVSFDDASHQPTGLHVSITTPGATLGGTPGANGGGGLMTQADVLSPEGRAIRSGDSFVVLLPDAAAGGSVNVDVDTAGDAAPLHGAGAATPIAHAEVELTVTLGVASSDAGVDASPADLAPPADQMTDTMGDLDRADGARPDAAPSDLTPLPDFKVPPDLSCVVGSTSCNGGMESTCIGNNSYISHACTYGCGGSKCLQPRDCNSPGDVSAGGTFTDTSSGNADTFVGSCGGQGGADLVTRMVTRDWRTVYLDTGGSSYDTLLYSRLTCGDVASEIPLTGPCPGALMMNAGTACNDNGVYAIGPNVGTNVPGSGSELTLCSLPPGTPVYTILDSKGQGGLYKLNVTLAPQSSSLNSCSDAGNLLDGARTVSATTTGHINSFASSANCSGGDNGGTAPDAIFFLALTTNRVLTVTTAAGFQHVVYVRKNGCQGGMSMDVACALSNGTGSATITTPKLAQGIVYIIVDGVMSNGKPTSGDFTLTVQ